MSMKSSSQIHPAHPVRYQVRLQGLVSADWSDWLHDLTVMTEAYENIPVTTLTGTVKDQAALFGLLSFIRDLGAPLISLNYLPGQSSEE
jgi:hypothetical protein